jgi:PPM family protein phosphatase
MELTPTPVPPPPSRRAEGLRVASEPSHEPSHQEPLRIEVAARTDRGCERGGNEDSYLVVAPPGWAALAVCDGMGGAAGGEVASRTAVETIQEVMEAGGAPETSDALGWRLLRSVEEAARRVFALAGERPSLKGMGTTTTACALSDDALFVAQVGDSRAYLLRDGELTQVTRDQTLATILVERGQLAPEDVASYPFGHVILQAVGTQERVEVDLRKVRVAEGDVIVVSSDGLHGVVEGDAMRDALTSAPSLDAACEALVALAKEAGGPDNITVVVARVTGRALMGTAGPPVVERAVLTPPPAEDIGEDDTAPEEPPALRGVLARLAAIFRGRRGG